MNTNDNNNGSTNNNQIPAAATLAAPPSFSAAINAKPERSAVEQSILSLIEESPRIRELELRIAGVEGDDIESKVDEYLSSASVLNEIADEVLNDYKFERAVQRAVDDADFSDTARQAARDAVDEYDFSDVVGEAATEAVEMHDFSDTIGAAVREYMSNAPDELEELIKEVTAAHAEPVSNERLDALEQRLAKVERMMEQITTLTKCIVDLAGAVNADSKKVE